MGLFLFFAVHCSRTGHFNHVLAVFRALGVMEHDIVFVQALQFSVLVGQVVADTFVEILSHQKGAVWPLFIGMFAFKSTLQ